ncbi:MAG: transketolase [Candidatus Omnitrophica bacterium]|jgi:transketolase|nr:transketolase [Candidatus Omnitrophota bacterium]
MRKEQDLIKLKKKAIALRKDILKMLYLAGSGHPGGSLSLVEIMTCLFYYEINYKAKEPKWEKRDKVILSKGHGCPALYAILSDRGYFKREELWTLRQLGSKLQGHPSIDCPGVEISSGSLGQGLSISNGMALANKMDKNEARVYCIIGDGEMNEGQIWEGAMTASHYSLENVCLIVDHNKLQIDGPCCDIKDMEILSEKLQSFGFEVIQADGHDFSSLIEAFNKARTIKNKPQAIIANTIKGAGISFMENKVEWHGVAPNKEQYEKGIEELEAAFKILKEKNEKV